MGNPAEVKAKRVKKRKTDRNDALLLLRLMRENNSPQIWVPTPGNRDLRQLLWHRHRLVQMRTRIMNQLQALAMSEGYRWKKKLFSEQGRAQLDGHNGCFRADLLLRQNGSGFQGDGSAYSSEVSAITP
jgi:transposase